MKSCPNCRSQMEDQDLYCPVCGSAANAYVPPNLSYTEPTEYAPVEPEVDSFDHTDAFSESDIREHKLLCMLIYLLDFIGIIIALLAAKESEYTAFHMKQSMKFTICEALVGIATILLGWTVIVPIAAAAALVALMVLKLISFSQVCMNKAKEPAIIRSIKFFN